MKYEITFEIDETEVSEPMDRILEILKESGAVKISTADYSITPELAQQIRQGKFLDVRGQVVKFN